MKRKTGIALLLALLLFSGSCNLSRRSDRPTATDTGPRVYGDPNATYAPGESPPPEAAAAQPPPPPKKPGGNVPNFRPGAPPPTDEPARDPEEVDDLGYTGAAARPMLRPEPFTEIVIEVDYVSGKQPDPQALDYMIRTLREITGKKVTLQGGNEIAATDGTTSGGACRSLSSKRNTSSVAPRVSLYLAFLNGGAQESNNVLGFAVAATVTCFFPDRWRNLANVNNYAVEGSIILHEVGHLLAQTEIDYTSPRHRKDEAHGNHTKNSGSVMYYAVETTGISSVVRGAQPLAFDADDLADFRDMAAGRL